MADISRVGFIGLGMMGHGMAGCILASGYELCVLGHRNRVPVENLLGRGATEASSAKALAQQSDAVVLCVTGSPQVEEIVYGENGLLAGIHPGLIVIDATTSDPNSTRKIAADFVDAGGVFVDAPVTRAPKDAEAGRLNSLVGADPDVFEIVKPLIKTYSETIERFGPVGAGHTAKLVNNFVTAGYTALIAEGFSVAAASGVDLERLYKVMSAGGADSGVLRKMVPPMLDGDLTGHQFAIKNADKDVGYFRRMIDGMPFDSIVGTGVFATYEEAVSLGLGEKLMASLLEMHEKRNGIKVVPEKRRTEDG